MRFNKKKMTKKFIKGASTLLIMLAVFAVGAFAQSQASSGQITGVITDSTGAVVPNATIVVISKDTEIERSTNSNASGIYKFIILPPGTYKVRAIAPGFDGKEIDAIVNVSRTVDVDFQLGIGEVSVTVDVSGDEIQSTSSTPDAVLDDTAISELPINGRRFQDLATLTPTAQVDPSRGQISLSGQRGINANINVDGADYSQPFFGGIRGGERSNSAFTLPQESVREFNVISAGYSAEFGRSTGGIINVVTKTGGNNLHGSAFYLLRHKDLARANSYANAVIDSLQGQGITGTVAPTQQQFGGSIGGPIVRDKLFFFGSYEQQKVDAPRQVLYRNSLDVDSTTLTTGQLDVFNTFKGLEVPFTLTNNAYAALGNIKWQINESNELRIRGNYSRNKAENAVTTGEFSVDPTTNKSLLTNGTEEDKTYGFVGQWVSFVSSNMVNEFRGQYTREDRPRLSNSQVALVANTYGDIGTRSFLPTTQYDTRLQLTDNLTYLAGEHAVKFGFDFNRMYADQSFGFSQFGNYNYYDSNDSRFLDVLSNVPNTNSPFGRFDNRFAYFRTQVGDLKAAYGVTEFAGYVQDSWRVTPSLTLNYGLRLSKQFNPDPELGNTALINEVQGGSYQIFGGNSVDPTQIVDSPLQFGPRLGFAWDPNADGKTVVRAFGGMYYARTPMLLLAGAFNNFRTTPGDLTVRFPFSIPGTFDQTAFDAANPDYVALVGTGQLPNTVYRHFAVLGIDLNNSDLTNMPNLTSTQLQTINNSILTASGLSQSSLGFFGGAQPTLNASDYENPTSVQAGAGFEHELYKDFIIGIDYSFVKTTQLQRNLNINQRTAVTLDTETLRPIYSGSRSVSTLGNITYRESSAKSVYNAVTFRTRFQNRYMQISAYYVLSDSRSDDDNERSAGGYTYDDAFHLNNEFGYSALDRRHQFSASPIFFLPYGFEVSSTIRLRSGLPFDSLVGSDLNNDGTRNDRPYLLPGTPLERNYFRQPGVYDIDLRVQKGFTFGEDKELVFTGEFFNIMNLSNIQFGFSQRRYCNNSNSDCGLSGITNTNFRKIKDSNGDIITSNYPGSQVFQAQLGVRFRF